MGSAESDYVSGFMLQPNLQERRSYYLSSETQPTRLLIGLSLFICMMKIPLPRTAYSISAILFTLPLTSCKPLYRPIIERLPRDEYILCGGRANVLAPYPRGTRIADKYLEKSQKTGESPWMRAYIQVNAENSSDQILDRFFKPEKFRGRIEVQEKDDRPLVTFGERFKVNDIITFKQMSWRILDMGNDGIRRKDNNHYICRYDFMHLKELNYRPLEKE